MNSLPFLFNKNYDIRLFILLIPLPVLELQAAFACAVSRSFYTAMVQVTAPVEYTGGDT